MLLMQQCNVLELKYPDLELRTLVRKLVPPERAGTIWYAGTHPIEGEIYCNISIYIIYFVESIITKFNLL